MNEEFLFSIIIPFQNPSDYLYETLEMISKLKGISYEVILLPDFKINIEFPKFNYNIIIIETGSVSPAIKRDIGANNCCGKFLAFIDDDAYPDENWLNSVIHHFKNKQIAAVGGPQITPETDTFWQKVSGATFLSPLNGKSSHRYYSYKKCYLLDDWPSVNLIVRKDVFVKIGGFNNDYWPGEDTKLCDDLIKNNFKILYEPTAIVYHHRRAGYKKHMKQIGNYGLHRGFFSRKLNNSYKISFFIPSLFFLYVISFSLAYRLNGMIKEIYVYALVIYLLAILYSTISIYYKIKNILISLSTIPYIISTHFWYGWNFIRGFFLNKQIVSKLGR